MVRLTLVAIEISGMMPNADGKWPIGELQHATCNMQQTWTRSLTWPENRCIWVSDIALAIASTIRKETQ